MNNRTKLLQFNKKMLEEIFIRDNYTCIFCKINYKMPINYNITELKIKDPMHYIPKSRGGLGIRKNGACGCRYHHNMYDNAKSKTTKEEMKKIFKSYLKNIENNWKEEDLKYNKYKHKNI